MLSNASIFLNFLATVLWLFNACVFASEGSFGLAFMGFGVVAFHAWLIKVAYDLKAEA